MFFTLEEGGAVIHMCRSPLVATQHAIYQTTDVGNAETWAAVAMVAIAGVVDRSRTPVVPTSVSCAMTAASISASGVSPQLRVCSMHVRRRDHHRGGQQLTH